ncbi:dnaJ homolog subfamily C member 10-like [Lineus longissimus]|uniref:dnaJ homolog subfamily C member 10-like n=1 Tax=Lineus longissimus TaxID=88925 RepID=UPI002B4EB84B
MVLWESRRQFNKVSLIFLLTLLLLMDSIRVHGDEDYYKLLGVAKDADNRDIRRAFKKLAVTHHPDKNTDDPQAHDKFLKINRAYEVLKDADLRKKYDTYGEAGLKDDHPSNQYQSWNFYQEEFGLYDEDKEIITLSRIDFEQSVKASDDIWFVNFYSPHCSHCHDLAPSWREVARELEGVVRIGAVNCGDDWQLCRQQGINGYPSLLMYPSAEKYHGQRNTENLVEYALKFLKASFADLTLSNFDLELKSANRVNNPWLITFCGEGGDCLESKTCLKLAAMLNELINVGMVDCHKQEALCSKLGYEYGTYFFPAGEVSKKHGQVMTTLDAKELAFIVLEKLPDMPVLDADAFSKARTALKANLGKPWLIHFTDGDTHDLELRKLPAMLDNHQLNVGRVDCRIQIKDCQYLHIHKLPTFTMFKKGGGHEIHHGRQTAHDIVVFARDSATTPVVILGPGDFPDRVVKSKDNWFVDFYAPWCPPCMQLLPEFRKASKEPEINTKFGTVDCTIHGTLCQNYNIRSYPTTVFYNGSIPHTFRGRHNSRSIVEFIRDTLNPPVIILTPKNFQSLVENKDAGTMWAIDFFMPWCGPCQQLAPEWTRLAKMFVGSKQVKVGHVNCQDHKPLCVSNGVQSYPAIRLYPNGPFGTYYTYNGFFRNAPNLRAWIYEYLPSRVRVIDASNFDKIVLSSKEPWVVDFFAPWCGHCQHFAPNFERVAHEVAGRARCGKVNCDERKNQNLCGRAGIQGYPSVFFYSGASNGRKQSPVGQDLQADGDYIIQFINHHFPRGDGHTQEESESEGDGDDFMDMFFHDEL